MSRKLGWAAPLALALVGSVIPSAAARTAGESSEPVIDSAPRLVGFARPATIRAHVPGSAAGDPVGLQRRRAGRSWRPLVTKEVDEDGRVTFRRRDVRMTARYRVVWSDADTGGSFESDAVRIRVKPRLTFRLGRRHLNAGRSVVLRGRLLPQVAGRKVRVQRWLHGRWRTIDRVRSGDGSYRTRFRPARAGRLSLRVRFAGDALNVRARRLHRLRVYDPDLSTWYGPGLYGNRTACGRTLRSDTLGVAHKTLPCGTSVALLYGGRTIRVRVIDRGPYSGAEWDLTEATARRIGFSGSGYVGTLH